MARCLTERLRNFLFLPCLSLVLSPAVAWAAPGDLDTTFGTNGIVVTDVAGSSPDDARAVAVQPDGKILVAGTTNLKFSVARYNTDGSLDTGFGNNGVAVNALNLGDTAFALVLQPDGKILVGGTSITTQNEFAVLRLNGNGSLDATFDGDGKVTTPVGGIGGIAYAIALQPDNKVVLAGYVNKGSDVDFAVVRYNGDGSLDTSFDGDGKVVTAVSAGSDDVVYGLAIQPDGKIVAVGPTNVGDFGVVRYNTDGSPDTGFGTNGIVVTPITADEYPWAVALQPDRKIVVVGQAVHQTSGRRGFAVVRYGTTGSLDTTFGGGKGFVITDPPTGSIDVARAVVVQPDGKIVVAGTRTSGDPDFALARYNANGSLDTGFAGGGMKILDIDSGSFDQGYGLAVQPDGKFILAGQQQSTTDFALARFEGFDLDVTPDAFSFTDETGVGTSQVQTSNLIAVSGLDTGVAVPVSVIGGEYALNGATSYTRAINWVKNGDQINVRHTSAADVNTTVNTLLGIGGVMAPNGTTHLGTDQAVTDIYSTTTGTATGGGGGGGGSLSWFGLIGAGVLVFGGFRRRRRLT